MRLNYGSSGLSLNIGVPGASMTVGANGVYANTGLPGTGIRNRQKIVSATSPDNVEDIQVTEKAIKRAGCVRNLIYYFCYSFSYVFIIAFWLTTGYTYSTENYWYLIPAILCLFFIINTIRLHIRHHSANVSSSRLFPIILTSLMMLFVSLCGVLLYMEYEPIAWTMCIMLDIIWAINLYVCFKYRVKKENRSARISEVLTEVNGSNSDLTPRTTNTTPLIEPVSQAAIPTKNTSYTPSLDYTKESLLYFSQKRVRKELEPVFSPETIDICAYIVGSEKCVLSDIQAELGISYQKVLESVKLLEKARIVKAESNRHKVMVTDETIAIRLLLRYAKESML